MADLFVYQETEFGALDTGVCAVVYQGHSIPDWVSIKPNLKDENRIGELIDQLEEEGSLVYEHDFVSTRKINLYGVGDACRVVIDTVIPGLMLKTTTKIAGMYRDTNCTSSYYYPLKKQNIEQQPLLGLASWVCWFKRKWKIESLWNKQYPEYQWLENRGRNTIEHALLVLEHGPSFTQHYNSFLKRIPQYLLHELRKGDPKYLFGQNYCESPPLWWRQMFKGPFTAYLNKSDQKELQALCGTGHTTNFLYYLRTYKPLTRCTSTKRTTENSMTDSQKS